MRKLTARYGWAALVFDQVPHWQAGARGSDRIELLVQEVRELGAKSQEAGTVLEGVGVAYSFPLGASSVRPFVPCIDPVDPLPMTPTGSGSARIKLSENPGAPFSKVANGGTDLRVDGVNGVNPERAACAVAKRVSGPEASQIAIAVNPPALRVEVPGSAGATRWRGETADGGAVGGVTSVDLFFGNI